MSSYVNFSYPSILHLLGYNGGIPSLYGEDDSMHRVPTILILRASCYFVHHGIPRPPPLLSRLSSPPSQIDKAGDWLVLSLLHPAVVTCMVSRPKTDTARLTHPIIEKGQQWE